MKRLDEIEARTTAATEGPWEAEHHYNRLTGKHVVSEIPRVAECEGNGAGGLDHAEDAEFISHARQDVPALVAALRAVLEVHRPISVTLTTQGGGVQTVTACDHTTDFYPCRTVRAIRQHLGEDA